jgi:RNA polymerase primary sigma factor
MNEHAATGLHGGLDVHPAGAPERAPRRRSSARRGDLMPYPKGERPYLDGLAGHGLLTREGEVELAQRVEAGERAIVEAFVQSPAALHELAAVGQELAQGRLQVRDVLRSADEDELVREEASRQLIAAFKRAGTLARAAENGDRIEPAARRRLLEQLEGVRLHRRMLDRVVGALRAAPAKNKAARRALEAVEAGRRSADLAKAEFVRANTGLVVMFAKRQVNHGLPLHDLIQEGNIGLMRAVDKFDHRRGLRFSTYAAWWVRQQMTRAVLDQARTIRVPVHLAEARQHLRRVQRVFEQAHGRAPSEAELGEQSGIWPEKVQAILGLTSEPISLDAPVGEDHEARLGDFVADRVTPAPDEELARTRMQEQMKRLLERLSPREQDILRRRFGLDDAPEQTLAEIGASLSLSRERIRQIEAEALRKLRAPSESGELDSYLTAA